jgi:two-component system sensor histidine kinase CpxA
MAIIIIAQFTIAGLFRIVGKAAGNRGFRADLAGITFMLNESVKHNYNNEDIVYLEDLVTRLGKTWSTDIWIENVTGKLLTSSTAAPRPEYPAEMERVDTAGDYKLYRNPGGPPTIFLKIVSDNGLVIYAKRDRPTTYIDELNFSIGLVLITVIVAIVLLPISRRITSPLKRLTESANAIARGEFDRRVDETAHDEIGELARAFNMMSGRVLQMINGTKELTANISHQVRSPLARMSVAAGILRDKISAKDYAGAKKNISFIEKEIEEMDKLTGRIIELLRVDTVHKTSDFIKLDLQKAAADASAKYSDMISANEISFNSELTSIPCVISGVPDDIQQLFDILFDNAVRYAPPGGFINIEMHPEKGSVSLNMSNSSHEMTGVISEKLFEPFSRMAPENIPGNGLGLAIAKRIMINHDGDISAEYSDGIFSVRLRFPSG